MKMMLWGLLWIVVSIRALVGYKLHYNNEHRNEQPRASEFPTSNLNPHILEELKPGNTHRLSVENNSHSGALIPSETTEPRLSKKGNTVVARKESKMRCQDWIPYKGEKCLKVAYTAGVQTQEDAENLCYSFSEGLKLEYYPRLVSIATNEKQQFLHQLLFVENKIVDNVWLGLKETDERETFLWNDGSNLTYFNWADQNASKTHICVEMKSGEGGFAAGQWVKVNCLKRNVVVCERAQTWSIETLQNMFLEYRQQQEKLQNESVNEINSLKKQYADKSINSLRQNNDAEEVSTALKHWKEESDKIIAALKQKNDALEKAVSDQKEKHDAADQAITALLVRNDAADKIIRDVQQKYEAAEKAIETLTQKNEASEKTTATWSQKHAIAVTDIASLQQKTEASDKIITSVQQKSDNAEKTINDLKQRNEAAEKNFEALKQKSEAFEKNLNALTLKSSATDNNIGALTFNNQEAKNEIDSLKKNPVPVGYIYVELPGQQPPTTLWPQAKWSDVSAKYAGQFFRVVGGGSAPFGKIQEGASTRLEQVEQTEGNHVRSQESNPVTVPGDGSWSRYFWDGTSGGSNIYMRFRLSKTEIRPRNQAVKVWQRIQ